MFNPETARDEVELLELPEGWIWICADEESECVFETQEDALSDFESYLALWEADENYEDNEE